MASSNTFGKGMKPVFKETYPTQYSTIDPNIKLKKTLKTRNNFNNLVNYLKTPKIK